MLLQMLIKIVKNAFSFHAKLIIKIIIFNTIGPYTFDLLFLFVSLPLRSESTKQLFQNMVFERPFILNFLLYS